MKKSHLKLARPTFNRLSWGMIGALLIIGTVQADDSISSTDIKASVSLISDDNCIPVVGTATNPMAMRWTRNQNGTGQAALTSSGEPSNVVITITGGSSCSLNTLRLTTSMGGGAVQGPDYQGQNYTWLQPIPGSSNGQWRFLPYLARAQFFTGNDAITGLGTAKVHWHSPSNGYDLTFEATAKHNGGELIDIDPMGGESMFLTDEYVTDGGALLMDKNVTTGVLSTDATSEIYKSAILGFGAMMATGPENTNFVRDDTVVSTSGQVNMNWTVSVSLL
ncbi:hypothetical protein [Providencia rettgeri]|uniref:hypothetical protein n=1 Tax=Providencia rettgeri TaxID=587 RepID=UPI0014192C48|nr:hypothetical protein [Providencia rettgeri]NIH07132.1 hypothetical protein [Providencia rettgeri]